MASSQIVSELEKRVTDAFCIFDHHGSKSIDVREVGTVIRYLGCAPTEQEINEVISATESETSSGEVHLNKFLPYVVSHLLFERRMEPAEPEQLMAAFEVLDTENKGYLTKEHLSKLLLEEGEPFTQEELDELLAIAVDPQTGHINYEHYLNHLMVYL